MSIGEIPDVLSAALTGHEPERAAASPEAERRALTLREATELVEMRLAAGFGYGQGFGGGFSLAARPYDTNAGDWSNPWGGWSGWGGVGRCPPQLIMSTAALRCRVVILDNLAKARPIIRDKDTLKEYTGEFAEAIAKPMGEADPYMSLKRWVTVNVSAMLEIGDAHIWKSEEKYLTRFARNGKALRRAFIPLPVGSVEPQPGKAFWKVSEWTYADPTTGQVVQIPPEEMARIEYLWNPRDYHRGVGPMEACRLAVETDYWYALQGRNRQMKGGLPALLLMNQRAGTQDQELKAFLAEFRRQMADERGGVAGLGSDWKVERLGMTAVEADEINARRYMVEEIARAHGVPLIDLNVYESTGFGREGMAILNRMRHTATIEPLSERFADGVSQQIVAEVEPSLEFAFDWSEVKAAQDDFGEAIEYASRLFAMGVPMDECARITSLALEDYEGKDLGFLAAGLLTMEEIQLRLEQAKNPPEPPPQLAPFAGPGGPAPGGGGRPPEFDSTDDDETPEDAEPKKKGEDDRSEGVDDQGEGTRAARVRAALAGARLSAAAVLSTEQLDSLEARAHRVGVTAAAFDRLVAQSTPRETEASIAFQGRVSPYSKKIRKIYERGVNRAFKTVNDRLWKLKDKRPKIRLLAGEPEPEGKEILTDSKGRYYFGAVDPQLVDPLVENIGLDSVIDDILDEAGEAFDEGVETMHEEMRGLGWLAAGATVGAALLARAEAQREAYLSRRRALVGDALERVRRDILLVVESGLVLEGAAVGTISKELMGALRPTLTGGGEFEGRGQLWGDEEAYNAANAGRAALAQLQGPELDREIWWRWLSMADERARPSHQELHGTAVPVGSEFGFGLTYPGDPNADPDQTINCVLPGTLVGGRFLGGLKALYAGEAIEVRTRRGDTVTVTVNHPILTARGIVKACDLREGDHVVCERGDVDGRAPLGHDQEQQRPARVEDVFDALAAAGTTRVHQPLAFDLDGDAQWVRGEIDLVIGLDAPPEGRPRFGNPKLMSERQASRREFAGERDLVRADSPARFSPIRPLASAANQPRPRELTFDSRGVLAHGPPLEGLRFRPGAAFHPRTSQDGVDHVAIHSQIARQGQHALALDEAPNDYGLDFKWDDSLTVGRAAQWNTPLPEKARYDRVRNSAFIRELLLADASLVTTDEIVQLRRFKYVGHVFDLQSEVGYFSTGRIASRNCRCWTTLLSAEEVASELAA
jgi:hypothetical protein